VHLCEWPQSGQAFPTQQTPKHHKYGIIQRTKTPKCGAPPPPSKTGMTLGGAVVRHSKRSLISDLVGFNAAMAACDQGQQWAPLMV